MQMEMCSASIARFSKDFENVLDRINLSWLELYKTLPKQII